MTLSSTTIRPGLLVSLKTSIQGNVNYVKTDIERMNNGNGETYEKWETEKRVADAAEYEAAKRVRSKVTSLLRSVCAQSSFGLLCPENRASELEQVIQEARDVAKRFNNQASVTCVRFNVICGRVAADDAEAMRSINSEVRDLLSAMSEGCKSLDPDAIREAANKAKQLGSMLSPEAEQRMESAIKEVRRVARSIVKSGETAAMVVDQMALAQITQVSASFLDFGDEPTVSLPVETGVALDFMPDEDAERLALEAQNLRYETARQLDMGD